MFSVIKNGKKRRRNFFYATAVLLFCSLTSSAQPTCSAYFDPAETCHREIQNQEYVFLGRVISIEKLPGDEFPAPLKVLVEVEAPLKGELARLVPELASAQAVLPDRDLVHLQEIGDLGAVEGAVPWGVGELLAELLEGQVSHGQASHRLDC